MTGVELIEAERRRQVEEEGWTPEHDDEHGKGEMAIAAACFAGLAAPHARGDRLSTYPPPFSWPWDAEWWKPSDEHLRNLVRAGALIAAEIDRILRGTKGE